MKNAKETLLSRTLYDLSDISCFLHNKIYKESQFESLLSI